MRLDPGRLVPAATAATRLPALLSAALAGHPSHFIDDDRVLAHLVPPNALVVTEDVEGLLLSPAVRTEAVRFAAEVEQAGYHHPGTAIGAILAWLWSCSPGAALRWLAAYATEVSDALTERGLSRPSLTPLWTVLRPALAAALEAEDVADFEAAALDRFGAHAPWRAEATDPWPEMTPGGRCFAKKRYDGVRVGDFIPVDPAAELDYDDHWCRVEQIDPVQPGGVRLSLRDADGQRVTLTAADVREWVPSRGREPWHWGLPQ